MTESNQIKIPDTMFFTKPIVIASIFTSIPKLCLFLAFGLSVYNQFVNKISLIRLLYLTVLGFIIFSFTILSFQACYDIFLEGIINQIRPINRDFFIHFFGLAIFSYFLMIGSLFYISFTLNLNKAFDLITQIAKLSLTLFVLPLVLIGFDAMLISVLYGFYLDPKTFNILGFIIVSIFVVILSLAIIGYFNYFEEILYNLKKKKINPQKKIYKKRNSK